MKKKYLVSFIYGGEHLDDFHVLAHDREEASLLASEEFDEYIRIDVTEEE